MYDDFSGVKHPVAGLKELIGAHNAHRHDGGAEFLSQIENAFFEWLHVAVSGARAFRERDQADARIESPLRSLRHNLQAFARRLIGNRDVSESSHHPPVNRNLEVRLQLKASEELRNRGVDHKRIEQIDVVADEDAGALGVKTWRSPNFKLHSREPQDVPEENPLRPVILARVDENTQNDQKRADYPEMDAADGP